MPADVIKSGSKFVSAEKPVVKADSHVNRESLERCALVLMYYSMSRLVPAMGRVPHGAHLWIGKK